MAENDTTMLESDLGFCFCNWATIVYYIQGILHNVPFLFKGVCISLCAAQKTQVFFCYHITFFLLKIISNSNYTYLDYVFNAKILLGKLHSSEYPALFSNAEAAFVANRMSDFN